ncbi:MAG: hypothetical protein NTV52_17415 [Acidobacteria bacterium]|jgi:hypothetical protein|nr:hypothetical protein [Acidobacteriota bacterium]
MTHEEIQAYLDDNGYPAHIVEAGAPGVIKRWHAFVDEVEAGYRYRLDDYRHDLDLRGVIQLAGLDAQVSDSDARFSELLTSTQTRVWESSAEDPWWDFGYPRNVRGELWKDLQRAGLLDPSEA